MTARQIALIALPLLLVAGAGLWTLWRAASPAAASGLLPYTDSTALARGRAASLRIGCYRRCDQNDRHGRRFNVAVYTIPTEHRPG